MAYPKIKEDCKDMKSSYNCYKLLGFDILLDDNLKAWVLEVNTDPCLFADPVDLHLKSSLIAEMLNIVGFYLPSATVKEKKQDLEQHYPNIKCFAHPTWLYKKEKLEKSMNYDSFVEQMNSKTLQLEIIKDIVKLEEEASQCEDFTRIIPGTDESSCNMSRYYNLDHFSRDNNLNHWISFKNNNSNEALDILSEIMKRKTVELKV